MRDRSERLSTRIEVSAARGVMIVTAVAIVLTGSTMLTTPYAIPLTVTLWLGAAAILGLGFCGKLPHDE